MQHLRVPNMLHGRVVLPRGQRAYGAGAKPLSVDESSIKDIPGARVVRKGDFVGVVAEREWDAIKAARAAQGDLAGAAGAARQRRPLQQDARREDDRHGDRRLGRCRQGLRRRPRMCASSTYRCPYQGHLPFAPNCALADVTARTARTGRCRRPRTSTSRATCSRPCSACRPRRCACSTTKAPALSAAAATRMPAQAAAILSQAVGRPVRVQYMRWDEHGWDNYGPAHLGRGARRHRRQRQARRLRVSRLAAWLDRDLDGATTSRCRRRASSAPAARPRSPSTR